MNPGTIIPLVLDSIRKQSGTIEDIALATGKTKRQVSRACVELIQQRKITWEPTERPGIRRFLIPSEGAIKIDIEESFVKHYIPKAKSGIIAPRPVAFGYLW